jgi:hypothetical protein
MLKAIDTPYKGHLFRSRLEARWAVFFTVMGWSWEYEVEGFDLDGVWYLPDFKLKTPQGADHWIEIKPSGTKTDAKFELFAKQSWGCGDNGTYTRAELVSGSPLQWLGTHMVCPRCGQFHERGWFDHYYRGPNQEEEVSVYCQECDFETPGGGGHPFVRDGVFCMEYKPHKGDIITTEASFISLESCLLEAATQAQKARFEHGAQGQ